ncbi:MAG: choice-of-anchor tandem repeat GloVer-containing protein [Candidatus Sulfotelmatobacter sp.]
MRISKFAAAFLLSVASLLSAQTVSTILNFNGTNGANPVYMTFVQGRDGRLYGTTYNGGANSLGAVIKINLSDNNSVVVHSFDGSDGSYPGGGLTLATNGNYYGTTVMGGTNNFGVLYAITTAGTLTVLHTFAGGSDGEYPYGPPIQATDGNFYGATSGTPDSSDGATIYKLTSAGVYSVIFTFSQSTTGVGVYGLVQGSDGNLYAAANVGGADNAGTIVKVTTAGVLKETHTFNPDNDGGHGPFYPVAIPMLASNGTLYGTTQSGGVYGQGTIYDLSSVFGLDDFYSFGDGTTDGRNPNAGLVQGNDGNLYGVSYTFPEIYSWNLSDSTYDALASLGEGQFIATPMQDTNGIFYGVSEIDGTHNDGYVYSFNNGLSPFVAFVKPRGAVGASVEILGQGLTGSSSVTFNGVSASFTLVSDTYMRATVPSGATTGPVVVTTPTGTLTSSKSFTVTE